MFHIIFCSSSFSVHLHLILEPQCPSLQDDPEVESFHEACLTTRMEQQEAGSGKDWARVYTERKYALVSMTRP